MSAAALRSTFKWKKVSHDYNISYCAWRISNVETYGKAPALGFVQVVWDGVGIKDRQGGSVEGILGNRDHDTHFVVLDNHLQSQLDTGRGTLGQEDLGGIGSISIAFLDELGHILSDVRDTLGV